MVNREGVQREATPPGAAVGIPSEDGDGERDLTPVGVRRVRRGDPDRTSAPAPLGLEADVVDGMPA